jgi:hypothetical protein
MHVTLVTFQRDLDSVFMLLGQVSATLALLTHCVVPGYYNWTACRW